MSNDGLLTGFLVGIAVSVIFFGWIILPYKHVKQTNMLIRHNLMTVTNDASGNRVYFYTTNWIPEK